MGFLPRELRIGCDEAKRLVDEWYAPLAGVTLIYGNVEEHDVLTKKRPPITSVTPMLKVKSKRRKK